MPQRTGPPSAIKVSYINESWFDFKVSESSPPVLRGCEIGEDFKLSSVSPASKEILIELEQLADTKDASAFLTFEFGSQKLIVWVHLDPKLKFADIKVSRRNVLPGKCPLLTPYRQEFFQSISLWTRMW